MVDLSLQSPAPPGVIHSFHPKSHGLVWVKAPILTHIVIIWLAQDSQASTDSLPPSRPRQNPNLFLGNIKFFTISLESPLISFYLYPPTYRMKPIIIVRVVILINTEVYKLVRLQKQEGKNFFLQFTILVIYLHVVLPAYSC